jgi:hypothetical protein
MPSFLASSNNSGTGIESVRHAALERCSAEQSEIINRPDVAAGFAPAWLVTLGIEDWEMEKRFIEQAELLLVGRSQDDARDLPMEAKPC